jgi:hypothetical protein
MKEPLTDAETDTGITAALDIALPLALAVALGIEPDATALMISSRLDTCAPLRAVSWTAPASPPAATGATGFREAANFFSSARWTSTSRQFIPRFAQGGRIVKNARAPQMTMGKDHIQNGGACPADDCEVSFPDEIGDNRKTPERHFLPLGQI